MSTPSKVQGPIKIEVTVNGAHEAREVGILLARISQAVEKVVGKDFSVDVDWGNN